MTSLRSIAASCSCALILLCPPSVAADDGMAGATTLDGGHFELEVAFVDLVSDRAGGDEYRSWTFLDLTGRIGLSPRTDLELAFSSYGRERSRDSSGNMGRVSGYGDLQAGLKFNLFSSAAGAVGVMPFVVLPTGSDLSAGRVETGLMLMAEWAVGDRWGVGFMLESDLLRQDDTDGYDIEVLHVVALSLAATARLELALEYIGVAPTYDAPYRATLSCGASVSVTDHLSFGAGAMLGLTDSADAIRGTVGLAIAY